MNWRVLGDNKLKVAKHLNPDYRESKKEKIERQIIYRSQANHKMDDRQEDHDHKIGDQEMKRIFKQV
jgi:hypothetical protein